MIVGPLGSQKSSGSQRGEKPHKGDIKEEASDVFVKDIFCISLSSCSKKQFLSVFSSI